MLFRRSLLAVSTAALLQACASTVLTPAAIVAEASALGSGLSGMLTQLMASFPSLIPAGLASTIQTDLALAMAAAATLTATMPAATGASTAQTVVGDINAVLAIFAGPPINGLIPAPFSVAIAAAALLLPDIEAFIAGIIPAASASPGVAAVRAKLLARAPVASRSQALAILQGYAG